MSTPNPDKDNAALLFAPLRVVPICEGAAFEVRTRQDDTPGSRNNFVLCTCQQEPEANLFAAAPELLGALIMLLRVSGIDERAAVAVEARAAITKATKGVAA